VSIAFSFDPCARTKEEMLNTLHKKWNTGQVAEFHEAVKEQGERPRQSKNTHRMAFLCDQPEAVAYGVRNLMLRDTMEEKNVIALVDGGNGLEEAIRDALGCEGMTCRLDAVILDIVHALEYLWVAANAILGENAPKRQEWVEKHLLMMLDNRLQEVIDALYKHHDKPGTTKGEKKAIIRTIQYYQNHGHKMRYGDYLAKGYPVSTGLVEGACGHLIKDRMECSGMQWTKKGAQATLDARATHMNGDWDDFIHIVEQKNQERYYKDVG
jgi:hypothetical protein